MNRVIQKQNANLTAPLPPPPPLYIPSGQESDPLSSVNSLFGSAAARACNPTDRAFVLVFMARSPFAPMDERAAAPPEQGGRRGGAAKEQAQQDEQAVLLVHSQVRRIKQEDEEIRERLLKLRLLEARPAGGPREPPVVAWRASRSLSPLRRAGDAAAIPVGE